MPKILCKTTHIDLIKDHFLRLEKEARYLRFCGTLSDEGILNYIQKYIYEEPESHVAGIFCETNVSVIALVQIHASNISRVADFAFSVNLPYRNRGYSRRLFAKAIEIAKDFNCTTIHTDCLASNQGMIALAKAHRMTVSRNGIDAEGQLTIL